MAKAGTELHVTCPANVGDRSQRTQIVLAELVVDGPPKSDDVFAATSPRFIR